MYSFREWVTFIFIVCLVFHYRRSLLQRSGGKACGTVVIAIVFVSSLSFSFVQFGGIVSADRQTVAVCYGFYIEDVIVLFDLYITLQISNSCPQVTLTKCCFCTLDFLHQIKDLVKKKKRKTSSWIYPTNSLVLNKNQ